MTLVARELAGGIVALNRGWDEGLWSAMARTALVNFGSGAQASSPAGCPTRKLDESLVLMLGSQQARTPALPVVTSGDRSPHSKVNLLHFRSSLMQPQKLIIVSARDQARDPLIQSSATGSVDSPWNQLYSRTSRHPKGKTMASRVALLSPARPTIPISKFS